MALSSDKFEPQDVKRYPMLVSERDLRVLGMRLTGTEAVDGYNCGVYLTLEAARLSMQFNMDALEPIRDAKVLAALREQEGKAISEPFTWPFRLDDPLNPINRR